MKAQFMKAQFMKTGVSLTLVGASDESQVFLVLEIPKSRFSAV